MAKNQKNFSIVQFPRGIITLKLDNWTKVVNVQNLLPEGQFLVVKEEILKMGVVFTKKIENNLRKELNFPHD